jgi:N-acyl-D-aspartate/D-glutamate deacylase
VTDQATYVASTRPSSGIAHVIVGGTFVVRDGELVPDALPGRPVRASPR